MPIVSQYGGIVSENPAGSGGGGASIGGVVTGSTVGSVLFVGSGGVLVEDNANFFYDDTNKRFGLGTASPLARQHIVVNAIGTSPTLASGLLLDNQTPVTGAGAVQYAPVIIQRGRARKTNATAAEQTVDFRGMLVPADGAAAVTGSYQWGFSINGGAFNTAMTLTSTGQITSTALALNGSLSTGSTFTSANLWVNSASSGTQTAASGLYFGTSGYISLRTSFNGTTNYSVPASNNYGAVIIGAMPVTEASSGTHPILANLLIRSFAITNAAGATANAATVYIEGAPTGVTPTGGLYGLIVDSGNVRIDDRLSISTGAAPTGALLCIGAGSEQLANINFTAGTVLTAAGRGNIEYDGTTLFFTHGDSVRRNVATWVSDDQLPNAAGAIPVPIDYYGASPDYALCAPDRWVTTLVDGTQYASPLYNLG